CAGSSDSSADSSASGWDALARVGSEDFSFCETADASMATASATVAPNSAVCSSSAAAAGSVEPWLTVVDEAWFTVVLAAVRPFAAGAGAAGCVDVSVAPSTSSANGDADWSWAVPADRPGDPRYWRCE